MQGIVTNILFRNQAKLSNLTSHYSSKKSEDQDFLMIPGRTKVNQFPQIRQALLEGNFGNNS